MNFGNFLSPRKEFMGLDPFRFSNRMERLLEDPLFRSMGEEMPLKAWAPACDIFETEKELVMKFELPEVKREDVEVKIEQNVLTLRGERKFEDKTDRGNYHRVERIMVNSCAALASPCTLTPPGLTPSSKTACLP